MSEEIINGVDVSECMFYGNDECDYGYMKYNSTFKDEMGYPKKCKENSICYYKLLKRLENKYNNLKSLLEFEIQLREVFAEKCIKYEFALVDIRNMLKIADKAKKAEKHFEYMDKVLASANDLIKEF